MADLESRDHIVDAPRADMHGSAALAGRVDQFSLDPWAHASTNARSVACSDDLCGVSCDRAAFSSSAFSLAEWNRGARWGGRSRGSAFGYSRPLNPAPHRV